MARRIAWLALGALIAKAGLSDFARMFSEPGDPQLTFISLGSWAAAGLIAALLALEEREQ